MIRNILLIPNFGIAEFRKTSLGIPASDNKLISKLSHLGVKMEVIGQSLSGQYDSLGSLIDTSSVKCHTFGSPHDRQNKWGSVRNYFIAIFALFKVLSNLEKNTLVYIYFPGNIGLIAALLAIVKRKPYALYVRGLWRLRWVNRLFERIILGKAKWVLATGVGFCEIIKEYNDAVQPVSPMMAFDQDLGHQKTYEMPTYPKLLFVGRMDPSKGIYQLLDAMKVLRDCDYDVHLSLLAGGSEAAIENFKQSVVRLNMEAYVDYLGHLSDPEAIGKVYGQGDVFVYPSFSEGFPRVVYEAMSYGLPICCTILEGMKGFMRDEENCLAVDLNEMVDSLVKQIERLINDKPLRQRLGIKALKEVNQYLDQFNGIDHADQVFQNISNSSPGVSYRLKPERG